MLKFAGFVLYAYYLLLRYTVRITVRGREQLDVELASGLTPVVGITHASSLVSLLVWRGRSLTVLASRSKDGEFAARFLEQAGCHVVRGSSSRGGREAMDELRKALEWQAPVAITFDGPRGPALVPKPGVAALAFEASGGFYFTSICPLSSRLFGMGLCRRLGSWDRFFLPLPFARFEVRCEPVSTPSKNAVTQREWIAAALVELERMARCAYESKTTIS